MQLKYTNSSKMNQVLFQNNDALPEVGMGGYPGIIFSETDMGLCIFQKPESNLKFSIIDSCFQNLRFLSEQIRIYRFVDNRFWELDLRPHFGIGADLSFFGDSTHLCSSHKKIIISKN